jgi:hypothetical protein
VDRRAFLGTIAGSLVLVPLAAEAQQPGRTVRMGILSAGPPTMNPEQVVQARLRNPLWSMART